MASKKETFLLNTKTLGTALRNLSEAEAGQLLLSIYKYQIGEEYHPTERVQDKFDFIKDDFEEYERRYTDACRKKTEGIRRRWEKSKNESKSTETDDDTQQYISIDNNDFHSDNDISIISTSDDIDNNTDNSNKENISKKESSSSSPLSTAKVGDIILVKGCQVVKRSQGKIFKIPTQQEVESYITEKQYHFSASIFIDHYSNSSPHPWCKKDGTPVSNWKQCCTTFESTFLRSQGRISSNNQPRASEAHANINQRHYEQF